MGLEGSILECLVVSRARFLGDGHLYLEALILKHFGSLQGRVPLVDGPQGHLRALHVPSAAARMYCNRAADMYGHFSV